MAHSQLWGDVVFGGREAALSADAAIAAIASSTSAVSTTKRKKGAKEAPKSAELVLEDSDSDDGIAASAPAAKKARGAASTKEAADATVSGSLLRWWSCSADAGIIFQASFIDDSAQTDLEPTPSETSQHVPGDDSGEDIADADDEEDTMWTAESSIFLDSEWGDSFPLTIPEPDDIEQVDLAETSYTLIERLLGCELSTKAKAALPEPQNGLVS